MDMERPEIGLDLSHLVMPKSSAATSRRCSALAVTPAGRPSFATSVNVVVGDDFESSSGSSSDDASGEAEETQPLLEVLSTRSSARSSLIPRRHRHKSGARRHRHRSRAGLSALKHRMRSVLRSDKFEHMMMFVTILNAVVIGAEIDSPSTFEHDIWFLVDGMFIFVYLVEIVLKVFAYGWARFLSTWYNKFTLVITTVSIFEMVLVVTAFVNRNDIHGEEAIQLLQILRMIRLARTFQTFNVLVQSFVSMPSQLGWTMVLMAILFYVGCCCTTIFIGHDPSRQEDIRKFFKTLTISAVSLFEIMTMSWAKHVRPIFLTSKDNFLDDNEHERVHQVMESSFFMGLLVSPTVWFLALFTFVSNFLILNFLTAVVVQNMLVAHNSAATPQEQEREQSDKMELVERLYKSLVHEAGSPTRGISRANFKKWMEEKHVVKLLAQLEWSDSYMELMFDMCTRGLEQKAHVTPSSMKTVCSNVARPLSVMTMSAMPCPTTTFDSMEVMLKSMVERVALLLCDDQMLVLPEKSPIRTNTDL